MVSNVTGAVLFATLLLGATATATHFRFPDPSSIVDQLSGRTTSSSRNDQPEFCGDYECQSYTLDSKTDNYEVRTYPEGKYVITSVNDTGYILAYTKASSRLYSYFNGDNADDESFDFTTPMVTYFEWDKDGEGFKKGYAFGYWLPQDKQGSPPAPKSSHLEIVQYPRTTFYVKVFGGFGTEGNIIKQVTTLQDVLTKEGKSFDGKWALSKTYDPPQKLMQRHNEVCVEKTGVLPAAA